jgi:hypothetical protein
MHLPYSDPITSIIQKLNAEGWEDELRRLRVDKEFLNHPAVWQTKPLTDRSECILLIVRKENSKDV